MIIFCPQTEVERYHKMQLGLDFAPFYEYEYPSEIVSKWRAQRREI